MTAVHFKRGTFSFAQQRDDKDWLRNTRTVSSPVKQHSFMHRCTRHSPIWRPGGDSLCRYGTSGNVQVIAGLGPEGNSDGTRVLFSQPMGVCVENKKNIFVTDAQVGAVKLPVITVIPKCFSTTKG